MERSIIRKFKQLRVLPKFDFKNMDELVQDLTNALEESSSAKMSTIKAKKRRGFKRRSKKLTAIIPTLWQERLAAQGVVSEDSQSSFEDMKMAANTKMNLPTDSDELATSNCLVKCSSQRSLLGTNIPPESDSVNENFSPIQYHRRKRKFKRMAIDAAASGEQFQLLKSRDNEHCAILTHRGDIENMCRNINLDPLGIMCGKRKRSHREKSVDTCSGSPMESDVILNQPDHCFLEPFQRREDSDCMMDATDAKQIGDSSSSSLSSSESDAGVYTNDEGREGDDEQSDFYHEPGPACGIPNQFSTWWDSDELKRSGLQETDQPFHTLLAGSFQTWQAPQNFKDHVKNFELNGREIRAGRRRLRDLRSSFAIVSNFNEKISIFLRDPEKNELRLANPNKQECAQLNYLASLYSFHVRNEVRNNSKSCVLVKIRNTTRTLNVDHYNFTAVTNRSLVVNDIKRCRRTPPSASQIKIPGNESLSNTDNTQHLHSMDRNPAPI